MYEGCVFTKPKYTGGIFWCLRENACYTGPRFQDSAIQFVFTQVPDTYLDSSFDLTKNPLIYNTTGNAIDIKDLLGDEHITGLEFSFTSSSAGTVVAGLKVEFTYCNGQYGM